MKKSLLSALLLATCSCTAYAGVAVIVNPANGNAQMTEEQVQQLFLGKTSSFPNGTPALPVDQPSSSASNTAFYEQVVKKSGSQLKAYWTKLVFSGGGTPPQEVGDDNAVKQIVATNPNAIGYIDSAKVDASIKVVLQKP